jgi:hypothetical protein
LLQARRALDREIDRTDLIVSRPQWLPDQALDR